MRVNLGPAHGSQELGSKLTTRSQTSNQALKANAHDPGDTAAFLITPCSGKVVYCNGKMQQSLVCILYRFCWKPSSVMKPTTNLACSNMWSKLMWSMVSPVVWRRGCKFPMADSAIMAEGKPYRLAEA